MWETLWLQVVKKKQVSLFLFGSIIVVWIHVGSLCFHERVGYSSGLGFNFMLWQHYDNTTIDTGFLTASLTIFSCAWTMSQCYVQPSMYFNDLSIIEGGTLESSIAEGMDRTLRKELFLSLSRSPSLTILLMSLSLLFLPDLSDLTRDVAVRIYQSTDKKGEDHWYAVKWAHCLIKPLKV